MVDTYLNSNLLRSIQQVQTPLNKMFFSVYNVNLLQLAIRKKILDEMGYVIDTQNVDDLLVIMRAVFINNASQPNVNICQQVQYMNSVVLGTASKQIYTGLSKFIGYMDDITKPVVPPAIPKNTSIYGLATPINSKIGL